MYRDKLCNELEGLARFNTCPKYVKDALSLIKELIEDNEYLKTQLTATEARYESRKESDLEEVLELRLKVEELTEENERSQKYNAVLIEDNHILATEFKEITIADTVRKMQERLKQYIDVGKYRPATEICFSELDVANIIDRIAKEMIGDER